MKIWDAFISHASEDKDDVARPLANALRAAGVNVWFDEFTLRVGDSLLESIQFGLANSRYGIVILSPQFLRKAWTRNELAAIIAIETRTGRMLLPVWKEITAHELTERAPILADRFAAKWSQGLHAVVAQLLAAMDLQKLAARLPLKWVGDTGRLRLRQVGATVSGTYDWYEEAWIGNLHGELSGTILRYRWSWHDGGEAGSGYFVFDRHSGTLRGAWFRDVDGVDAEHESIQSLDPLGNAWSFEADREA